jgi:phosphotransferase system IIB component
VTAAAGDGLTDAELAAALLPLVGGAGNVDLVTACASRLRFVLQDASARDEAAIRAVPGVVMVLTRGDQFQVVLGARAIPVSREVQGLLG